MKPHLPIYTRLPNTLLRYEDERFTDRSGNSGVDRVAVYLDRNEKEQRMTAQIIWDKSKQRAKERLI